MSIHNIYSSPYGYTELNTDGGDHAFKKSLFGKVNSTANEWNSEYLTSSFRTSQFKIMSGAIPATPPTTVGQATAYEMMIQTGSTVRTDAPPDGCGRVYCLKDANDTTGRTWVTVTTGAFNAVSSRGTLFNSTGSDKDFILADWVAPWHVTGSSTTYASYQPRVYACWRTSGTNGGSVDSGPDTITEISASNKLGWVFYPEAGVLKFTNPTMTFSFENFNTFEENVESLSAYTDAGWSILSQTKTTTEHVIILGAGWASGSLASPTWRPLSDIITAHTGATTASCIAVEGYRYIGRSIYLG